MQGASSPITDWINSDVKMANTVSIIMIIFAAWAGIEAISNLSGIEIPPETGMATNTDPDDTQRANNGIIVGLGAVLGTLGIIIQSLIPRGEEEQEEERGPVFDEDLVKLTKWLCGRGTTTAEFFEWADVDNSGTIDMVEFANALRAAEIANLPPWEIEDLVKLMDINSDGRINLPELDIALLNIRNALSIEFIPYVEEEKPEEENSEDSSEASEDVEEDPIQDDEDEDSDEEPESSEVEDEESELEETESTEGEDEESELEEAESSEGEDKESELEETESTEGEDAEDEESDSSEGQKPESEETTETEVEESGEDSNEESEAHDDSNTGEEAQGNETAEESEAAEDESDDTEDDSVEETEESEEETPKKKKKF